jgi:hypothetical protein
MTEPTYLELEYSRRRFLAISAAAGTAATLGPYLNAADALAKRGKKIAWPNQQLSPRDALKVNRHQFMPVRQFRRWNEKLDSIGPANQLGLRATGSRSHERYVDDLRDLLEHAGVRHLHFENVPMQRWSTDTWSLDLLGGPAAGTVKTASYIPYSGQTPSQGVTAPLALIPAGSTPGPGSLTGKIAVFDVPQTIIPYTFFTALSYPGRTYDPSAQSPSALYKRPYLNGVIPMLEAIQAAGAVGAVGVLDYPPDGAEGSYFPYDGHIRAVPGLYVDRNVGATLKAQASAGINARLAVPAAVEQVDTRNLIGFIPGRSKDIVALHCHTDGSNAIEDNGPGAIVAIAQYLARLPRRALPCKVMILLTTGHFAGGNGSRAFIARHGGDLVPQTKAALTLEHLGLLRWEEIAGVMGPAGGYEAAAIFAPGSAPLVESSFKALVHGGAFPASVLKPLNPNASGDPNQAAWPGEGQYLFAGGGMPDANYITGPTYLLNWGIKTVDRCDHRRLRAEAIAFTEMILQLGRTPADQLRGYTL